jgi:hypothetical protein
MEIIYCIYIDIVCIPVYFTLKCKYYHYKWKERQEIKKENERKKEKKGE